MLNRKIALLFAGQGSQKVGMGLDFYNNYMIAKQAFNQLDDSIKDACFYGPETSLNNTIATQQALLVFEVAIAQIIEQKQINIEYCAGLSLGEYSALTFAKSLSLTDALKVVKARSKIMNDALSEISSSMMAVLNVPLCSIQQICEQVNDLGVCEIANVNSPNQVVISGHTLALEQARELLLLYPKSRVIPLAVVGAFHSSLLKDASTKLKEVLDLTIFNDPRVPIVFNVTGRSHYDSINSLLTQQIYRTVQFNDSIQFMIDQGVNTFVEISPKPIIKGLIQQIDPSVSCYCVSDMDSLNKLLEVLQ